MEKGRTASRFLKPTMKTETSVSGRSLAEWRQEIDSLDSELLRLLNRRAEIACELAAIKIAAGLPAYDGQRERQVLDRARSQNPGPLPAESLTAIFRRIILETRRLGTTIMRQQGTTIMRQQEERMNIRKRENSNGH